MPYAANGRVAQDIFPGAIEITEQQYAAAIDGIVNGMVVSIDGGFSVKQPEKPAEPEMPQPTINEVKAQLRARLDYAAEAERLKYITPGAGQAMTYQAKAAEAKAYLDAGNPDASDFPLLSAEVGITADSIEGVAQIVAGAYAQWQVIGAAIEAARLGGKAAIDAANDADAAQAAFDAVTWPSPAS
ncbi:hypothetical protein FHX08_002079 [Rhizobium sp. BK529]|uniref:hypothetical protein n=1 Tax=Rhizobium sp. BK529 TaxID=2586983 RepID=UPI0016194711|nr:hypothetical protein [Rhizobium sp. BK529]MBB3591735.1 hypothetical protein [Rhizobium sp. BK529]